MLEDLFAASNKYYHITISDDGKRTIGSDCPKDRFEELRVSDAEFYAKEGHHLYTNFETDGRDKT